MAINTYFQNIATAIREKTGESGLLTPAQMPDAIREISGGGGAERLTPYASDLKHGYVSYGVFYYDLSVQTYTDVYLLENTASFIVIALDQVVGDRFRVMMCDTDPTTTYSDIYGYSLANIDNPSQYTCVISNYNLINSNRYRYLIIGKTNQGVRNIKTNVIQLPL